MKKTLHAKIGNAVMTCALATALAAAAGTPTASPAGEDLILDRNSYFRVCNEFGLMKLNGDVLKSDGEKLFGAALPRIEQRVKRLLGNKGYDWTKTDWRDVACAHYSGVQAGDDTSVVGMLPDIPAPDGWTKPEFDDSVFDRQRLGIMRMVAVGEDNRSGYSLHHRGLYIRTYFNVRDPANAGQLTVQLVYRGGARVFVNGEELGRGHLPAGPVNADAFGADYPMEAYIAAKEELPERPKFGDWIGDLRGPFDVAPRAERQDPVRFRAAYGNTVVNRSGWERLMKLRDRTLGPIAIPSRLLRKGSNVLAIEIRTSRYHPMILAGARAAEHPGSDLYQVRNWGGSLDVNIRWDHLRLVNVELRGDARAVPSCLRRPPGMQVWVDDLHRRLYDRDYNPAGWPAGVARFVGGPNGTFAAQLAVGTDQALTGLKAVSSDLNGDRGASIPAAALQTQYLVGHGLTEMGLLGSGRCDPHELGYRGCAQVLQPLYRYSSADGLYGPLPKDGEAAEKGRVAYLQNFKFFDHIGSLAPRTVPANTCQPIWLSLKIPDGTPAGKYKGTVMVAAAGQTPVAVPVETEVIGWRVPSPREFQTLVQSEQTPYGIVKHYKIEPWSEKHWDLVESSFRQLARLGNSWVYVPVLMNTEIGNHEDTMVRWIRKKDGTLAFDYAIMDKYLALAQRVQGRPKVVCFLVMQAVASPSNAIKIFDEASGRTETLEIGPAQDATRRPLWRAFGMSLYEHMQGLRLEDVMYWGQAFDDVPDKGLIPLLAEVTPGVGWTCAGHAHAPDATFRATARAYGVDVLLKSAQGWKNPYIHLLMARTGGSVICVEGISTPFTWRVMCDRAIHCGFNGVGRAGADYFDGTWYDGVKGSYWCMVGRAAVQTLWPGAGGVETSTRNDAMLEGIQESEARIFIEQALDRKVLPEGLAKEVQNVLTDHFRGTIHIATGGPDTETMDIAQNWQVRSRRLYEAAARVAEKIGVDVDRTAFGESTLTLSCAGQMQSFTGGKRTVPALGRTRLALTLRNWSDKPRAWKAVSSDPWIVPEKTDGIVSGQQALGILLDGKALKEGTDVSGTLHVTDVTTGTRYPVKIVAKVDKAMDLGMRQDITFITGGGAGAESARTIHTVSEPVFNVTVGDSESKAYSLVNRAAEKLPWKIDTGCDWLAAEPAAGEMAPETSIRVKLVARPKDAGGAFHETVLTLTAGGGAVKEACMIKGYVLPPYRAPEVPAGEAVYLNDLDAKTFVKAHGICGGVQSKAQLAQGEARRGYPIFRRSSTRVGGGEKAEGNPEASPYTMGQKTFQRGLWVIPAHETTYTVEGAGFTAFASEVGFYDKLSTSSYINLGAVVNFEIYVDGKLRAQSGLMKFGDPPRLLVANDLRNAKEVKLVTRRDDLLNDQYTLATWGDPRFIK